jgi:hypothetical protein
VTLLQHAFDFHMPPGVPRWAASHQLKRRTVLARSRNRPLSGGEVETEGLGLMAHDMGYTCWGMPNLEIVHAAE